MEHYKNGNYKNEKVIKKNKNEYNKIKKLNSIKINTELNI